MSKAFRHEIKRLIFGKNLIVLREEEENIKLNTNVFDLIIPSLLLNKKK